MTTPTTTPGMGGLTLPAAREREAPLRMSAEEFRRVGHDLVDRIASFLERIPDGPVTPAEPPATLHALLEGDRALPDEGTDAAALLTEASALLFDHSLLNGHPRFFGYITSSPAPVGMLGDFLAAAVNANVGSWRLAPMATELEAQTVRWIAELLGYPTDCGGLLVSGGNMANMVGLFAARAAAARRHGWDVREWGVARGPRLRVYASRETHTWLQKATDLSGLGTDAIRWIPTDHALRMDVGALARVLLEDMAAGDVPVMVVGTAGTVSTGAVDPHKWLYAPLEAGCVLVREPARLREAFSYHPPYYHFGQEALNYVDFGPQNSRGFRALKVWLGLRQAGRRGYARMIADDCRLAERLHARVAAHPELEAATHSLSIATFRYVPPDLRPAIGDRAVDAYLDTLNGSLLERIQRSGEAFVSNAVVHGRYLLRACIVNFNTSARDVDALPEIVVRLGQQVDAELRSGWSAPT